MKVYTEKHNLKKLLGVRKRRKRAYKKPHPNTRTILQNVKKTGTIGT